MVGCSWDPITPVEAYPDGAVSYTGPYKTMPAIYTFLNQLRDKYPQMVRLYRFVDQTPGGRIIPLVRLILGSTGERPELLFVAGTHGDEAIGVEAMLTTIEKLADSAGQNMNRTKHRVIDFVPVHNPDGYAENERENHVGVDLNRNFPFGINDVPMQPETAALVNLVESNPYKASIFFHSANESKYENLIRYPVEYNRLGLEALNDMGKVRLMSLLDAAKGGNKTLKENTSWAMESGMVSAGGIASDWCMSGYLKPEYKHITDRPCPFSHPSVTVELCYPKQPLDDEKIASEKDEMYAIIYNIINEF